MKRQREIGVEETQNARQKQIDEKRAKEKRENAPAQMSSGSGFAPSRKREWKRWKNTVAGPALQYNNELAEEDDRYVVLCAMQTLLAPLLVKDSRGRTGSVPVEGYFMILDTNHLDRGPVYSKGFVHFPHSSAYCNKKQSLNVLATRVTTVHSIHPNENISEAKVMEVEGSGMHVCRSLDTLGQVLNQVFAILHEQKNNVSATAHILTTSAWYNDVDSALKWLESSGKFKLPKLKVTKINELFESWNIDDTVRMGDIGDDKRCAWHPQDKRGKFGGAFRCAKAEVLKMEAGIKDLHSELVAMEEEQQEEFDKEGVAPVEMCGLGAALELPAFAAEDSDDDDDMAVDSILGSTVKIECTDDSPAVPLEPIPVKFFSSADSFPAPRVTSTSTTGVPKETGGIVGGGLMGLFRDCTTAQKQNEPTVEEETVSSYLVGDVQVDETTEHLEF